MGGGSDIPVAAKRDLGSHPVGARRVLKPPRSSAGLSGMRSTYSSQHHACPLSTFAVQAQSAPGAEEADTVTATAAASAAAVAAATASLDAELAALKLRVLELEQEAEGEREAAAELQATLDALQALGVRGTTT